MHFEKQNAEMNDHISKLTHSLEDEFFKAILKHM